MSGYNALEFRVHSATCNLLKTLCHAAVGDYMEVPSMIDLYQNTIFNWGDDFYLVKVRNMDAYNDLMKNLVKPAMNKIMDEEE